MRSLLGVRRPEARSQHLPPPPQAHMAPASSSPALARRDQIDLVSARFDRHPIVQMIASAQCPLSLGSGGPRHPAFPRPRNIALRTDTGLNQAVGASRLGDGLLSLRPLGPALDGSAPWIGALSGRMERTRWK